MYHYADYKTIISPQNGMNLYRGCTHGCIYCDSRSHCYQINHDFENIEVKRNAPQILEEQLKKKKSPCIISTGSMCDSYIHLEEKLQITRRSLQVIEKYGFGVSILTKSARILRDLDILKAINKNLKCVVQITLTTYDENLCRIIEPNVSTTLERFRTLEAMRDAGIPTVVWICPILPFINDTEENLRGLMDYCVKAKVRGLASFCFGTTMREGSRDYFYKCLDRHFPGVKQKYIEKFGGAYACYSDGGLALRALTKEICRTHGIIYKPDELHRALYDIGPGERQISLFDE
ncbi:MAG: radical SAM protein [Oscillospiraceae bacterium]|nr:radical SAM protein [Oscillospiraceae bacterium]